MTIMAFIAVSFTMIYGECNSKDDPEPEPVAYTPGFVATSISGQVGGVDVIEFSIRCTTDDVELVRIDVRAPDGSSGTYTGNGNIWLQNEAMLIPDTFIKMSGTYTFTMSGTLKSGSHNGEGFTASASVSVSGK